MRVSIVGTGYVGLVTGVCLADDGHEVDVRRPRRRPRSTRSTAGVPPIFEDGPRRLLERIVGRTLQRHDATCAAPSPTRTSR